MGRSSVASKSLIKASHVRFGTSGSIENEGSLRSSVADGFSRSQSVKRSIPIPALRLSKASNRKSTSSPGKTESWENINADGDKDRALELGSGGSDSVPKTAQVDINVGRVKDATERLLIKMLTDGRITARDQEIYKGKFELFLQALLCFQEHEQEVLDDINVKQDTLNQVSEFVSDAISLGIQTGSAESETTETHSEDKRSSRRPTMLSIISEPSTFDGEVNAENMSEMSAPALRENLLKQLNKIELQQHFMNVLLLQLRHLEFEKALLEVHHSKLVKPGDIQKQTKNLKTEIKDLQMELSRLQQETQKFEHDIHAEKEAVVIDKESLERLDLRVLTKQMNIQANANKPRSLEREVERENQKMTALANELEKLSEQLIEGTEMLHQDQSKLNFQSAELKKLLKEEARHMNSRKQNNYEIEMLTGRVEDLIFEEGRLREKLNKGEERIETLSRLKKKLQHEIQIVAHATQKASKELENAERSLQTTKESNVTAKLAYDKMKSTFESSRPQEDASKWERLINVLTKEIGSLQKALQSHHDELLMNSGLLEMLKGQLVSLYGDQLNRGKEWQQLLRFTEQKRREREEKSQLCIRLEAKVFTMNQEIVLQKLTLKQCSKTEKDLHTTMEEVMEEYNKVKIARAALVNDLIMAKQAVSEKHEKIKISKNEVESYNQELLEREKEIHRVHYLAINASLARDSLRNHALRCKEEYRLRTAEKAELGLANKTSRKQLARLQQEVSETRSEFEKETHRCSQLAIQVRERTEEVCIVTEKIKAYEIVMDKGKKALGLVELEREQLEGILQGLEAQELEMMRKSNATVARFGGGGSDEDILGNMSKFTCNLNLEKLREQLEVVTKTRENLEGMLHDFDSKNRVRKIRYDLLETRETDEALTEKLSKLEEMYSFAQHEGLEKQLLLKQVAEITTESMKKANLLKAKYKHDTLQFFWLKKELKTISWKIDGMIAEVAIAVGRVQ